MDTRTALLDVAERSVRMRGFDGFSYADLAREVGIRKASIHHHFPAKQDMANALVARYAKRVTERLEKIANMSANAADAVTAFVALYRDATGDGDMLCLCVAMSLNRDMLEEATQRDLNAFHRLALDWLEVQFGRAMADGSIAGVSDPPAEALACLAQVEGAQIIARAAGEAVKYDAAMALLLSRRNGKIQ